MSTPLVAALIFMSDAFDSTVGTPWILVSKFVKPCWCTFAQQQDIPGACGVTYCVKMYKVTMHPSAHSTSTKLLLSAVPTRHPRCAGRGLTA